MQRSRIRGVRWSLLVAWVLVPYTCASCGGTVGEQGVSPLDSPNPAGNDADSTHDGSRTSIEESTADGGPNGSDSNATANSGEPAGPTAAVADLLGRFDAAISALYAAPLAAADDNHPLSVAWLDVVIGGSQLDRQVRGRILASGTEDGMRIVPDAGGTSFKNVALEVTEEPDGSLVWTNCGYAPGVGVDLRTGEVLDDNRTTTRGRGKAIRGSDGTLRISELWDDQSHLLAPGEPDPCVAPADRTIGSATPGTTDAIGGGR